MATEILFPEQTVSGFILDDFLGVYTYQFDCEPFSVPVDQPYTINWDGVEYICYSYESGGSIVIGNSALFGRTDTYEPFAIKYIPGDEISTAIFYANDTNESHDITVYLGVPDGVEGVILRNIDGLKRVYCDIDTVTLDTTTAGVTRSFTEGTKADDFTINNLVFGNGDEIYDEQVYRTPSGTVTDTITVVKPYNLIPENIAKDIIVAGIKGIFEGGSGSGQELKIKNKSFTVKNRSEVINHDMGVIPDIIIVMAAGTITAPSQSDTTRTGHILFSTGCSTSFISALGGGNVAPTTILSKSGSTMTITNSFGMEAEGSLPSFGYIRNANENTFTIGSSGSIEMMLGKEYHFIAISGIT